MEKQQSVDFTLYKLKKYREQHQEALRKTFWWQFKRIRFHKNEIDYYNGLLEKLGETPTIIDVALTVPDGILQKMGW